jgi:membrane-bound ClpP family serine protease
MNPLVWILLLLAAGLLLILLEVFIPSGGVLGLLAVLSLGAGIVTAFVEQGPALGMAVLGGSFLAVPATLMLAFRWFPATPLGRRVLPPPPGPEDVLPDADRRRRLRELVGRGGRTTSELMPWGSVEIDGELCEAVSEGGPIASGSPVEAVGIEGRALVVRVKTVVPPVPEPAAAAEPAGASPDGQPADGAAESPVPSLSRVLEEFDFDEVRKNVDPRENA